MVSIAKGTAAAADLMARAQRIIGLQDSHATAKVEAKKIGEQITEEFDDAESSGFNKKALRQCIEELRLDADGRQARFDFEMELDTYRNALGIAPVDGAGPTHAERIFSAMTVDERTEASVRLQMGEDPVAAITKAVGKRGSISAAVDEIVGVVSGVIDDALAAPEPPPTMTAKERTAAKADKYLKDQKRALKRQKASELTEASS